MTPIQWIARDLMLVTRAAEIAKQPLAEISRVLGVSTTSITGYTRANRNPCESVLVACREGYHVEFSYLLTALRNRKIDQDLATRRERARLAKRLKKLSRENDCLKGD